MTPAIDNDEKRRLFCLFSLSSLIFLASFNGGAFGTAFLWGMKRALFSSESGQGSSPIAHSAAKTDEPIREAVVAGLEPFIDTLVVCTLTSLVILSTGALERGGDDAAGEATFGVAQQVVMVEFDGERRWTVGKRHEFIDAGQVKIGGYTPLPSRNEEAKRISGDWRHGDPVFVIALGGSIREDTGANRVALYGSVVIPGDVSSPAYIRWDSHYVKSFERLGTESPGPLLLNREIYKDYQGATLTAYAINRTIPGWGTYLILLASWLFAISTMISWSYYGEQGIMYLFGHKAIQLYKIIYCILIVVATLPIMERTDEIGNLSDLGTGLMLWANIPIMLVFGVTAMKAYHDYFGRLRSGAMEMAHTAPRLRDVVEGRDVQ